MKRIKHQPVCLSMKECWAPLPANPRDTEWVDTMEMLLQGNWHCVCLLCVSEKRHTCTYTHTNKHKEMHIMGCTHDAICADDSICADPWQIIYMQTYCTCVCIHAHILYIHSDSRSMKKYTIKHVIILITIM